MLFMPFVCYTVCDIHYPSGIPRDLLACIPISQRMHSSYGVVSAGRGRCFRGYRIRRHSDGELAFLAE
jgi:hypothetical protein